MAAVRVKLLERLSVDLSMKNLLDQRSLYPMNNNASDATLADGTPAVEGLLAELGPVMGVSRVKLGRNTLGDGRFVHAPSTGNHVSLDSFGNTYWRMRFARAGRVEQTS